MLREGMFIAERYEVLEKIGSGGMSDVYKAKCHKLNRFVAIKVLKPEFGEDKTFVSKFRAEAQSAAGLMHSNIVNVYDVGEENGIHYIVMELVEGITLKKYIEKKGRLGVRESVSVAIQVAQGMEAAHKHHIVHRDIKPQNIIISKEGKVKVTDFGIARAASSNTINSTVMGSVHYISPEQARGGYSDEKSDIYSFGIMLFEMLTGKIPFEGDTTVAIALQHIQDDIVSPKEYVDEIPVSVEKIVLKCTQKKTEKRYQNATDLIADLKRSLVTPDEDFVIISSVVAADAPTQMIDNDEMAEISKKASVKAAGIDFISPTHEGLESRRTETVPEEDVMEVDVEDEDDDRDLAASKKIDKIIGILGIVIGAVIIIITIVVIVKMLNIFKGDSNTPAKENPTTTEADDGLVEVPLVIGYTFEQAKDKLNELGLGINEVTEYSGTYEAGVIFEQSVENGTRVVPNTTIIVTVSKGPMTFELPSVIGKTQSEAEALLKNKDLKVSYEYEKIEDEALWGTVKSSNPSAGTSVKSGDVVTLTIYTGPEVINEKVPDVEGMTLEEAKAELEKAGFTKYVCEYEYDDEVEKGKVITQSGAEVGKEAPVTTQITLVISRGKDIKLEEVPTVVGSTLEDAKKALDDAGFTTVTSTEKYSDTVAAGKVISISGATEGEEIDVTTAIELVVSKGPEPTEETTTQKPSEEETTTQEPSEEETTTQEPTEAETTTAALTAAVQESIATADLAALVANQNIDEYKEIKVTYFASYTDVDGTNISNKQIAAVPYNNYHSIQAGGETVTLSADVENVNVGDSVSIKIVVEYYKVDATEVSTAENTFETTFK